MSLRSLSVAYKDLKLEGGYRLDLLVEAASSSNGKRSTNRPHTRGHRAYVAQFVRQAHRFLQHFNVPVLKDGIRRYIWRETKELTTAAQRLTEKTETP